MLKSSILPVSSHQEDVSIIVLVSLGIEFLVACFESNGFSCLVELLPVDSLEYINVSRKNSFVCL